MAADHPFMQHLQQMLSGTVPMAGQSPGQVGGTIGPTQAQDSMAQPSYTDRAIALPPGPQLPMMKPPAPTPSVNADPAPSANPNGLSFGQSISQLLQNPLFGGGQYGVKPPGGNAGTSPAVPMERPATPQLQQPGPVGAQPGNFDFHNLLRNAQAAMPRRGLGIGEEGRSIY